MFKEYRIKKGLTQEMLGFKAGLDTRTIQRIEYGEMIPSLKTLSKLIDALNISDKDVLKYIKSFNVNEAEK